MTLQMPQDWRVIELSGEAAARSPNAPAYPMSSLKPFFDWQFKSNSFDFAIVATSRASFLSGLFADENFSGWLKVMADEEEAKRNQTFLEKQALEGFLLVATKTTPGKLESFFLPYGYIRAGEATLGDGGHHDLLGTRNDKQLIHAIALASKIKTPAICCFAHDADPLYLLSKGAAA